MPTKHALADFDRFYKENAARIYRYVFFRVGRKKELAEDLVSEIFMKALTHFDDYDPSVSKSAWIYRIAHNHLANYFRDCKHDVDLDLVSAVLVGENGNVSMQQQETQRQLQAALEKLPSEDRTLVTLKYLEGYSYSEMAELLDRTPDALKVATHRAMQKLRPLCTSLSDN